ncbi:hypothetical protein [Methylovulum psychrotolerans]|jgi:hypothetical protein|uniref:CRISPR-associated protein Cas2 n=1 Tax=Methylovulum psychrotolerans TaxID=1704499 RepID=A0A2S5CJZ5_9GAMM|nr:hypothetical protein [Methylovulum psychrotolerans]MBT9096942.1 hypothetical protein [Methylovulum psychrotolerans]POZ51131.1 hypothetical protein AADEFJLK_03089 [Methylovulum psychrotolerans]
MKQAIWLSYDLGVRGDYEGLYAWLDKHQAKECGDNIAHFIYDYTDSLRDDLKADLAQAVQLDKRSRLYVIYQNSDTQTIKGTFLFGGRKASPWLGFADATEEQTDDGA